MNAGMVGHEETTTEDEDNNVEEDGATGEWSGIPDPPPPPISRDVNHEEEYIDEEKYTTVTVEALDVSKEGIYKASKGEDHSYEPTNVEETESVDKKDGATKKAWTRNKPKSHVAKTKKFRYESKAERKVTRLKEKSGNRKKAKARKSE
jgi:ribosomal RNA-processing protein 17